MTQLTLTTAAVARVKKIIQQNTKKVFRISVKSGCAGVKYMASLDAPRVSDVKLEIDGLTVYLDETANSIEGIILDCVEKNFGWQWVFSHPNMHGSCGCGESFHV